MASVFIIDMSEEGYLSLCDAAFVYVEHESMFSGNSHEVVESDVVLLEVLSMDAEVISDSDHASALFQDLVNLLLEDVLAADKSWGQASKAVSAKW